MHFSVLTVFKLPISCENIYKLSALLTQAIPINHLTQLVKAVVADLNDNTITNTYSYTPVG